MFFLLRSQTMAVAALLLGLSVFLSRIFGLVRDKIISYYFGASPEADVYFTAFVVPDFLNYLLAGGYFSITLVPLLSVSFLQNEDDGWRFFSAATLWAFICISLLTIVAWAFAPQMAYLVAPGFTEQTLLRLTHFLRIILPAQVFFLPGACFSAILYYRRQFTVPAITPLIYNVSIIIGGLASFHLFPEKGMEGFCWGVLMGAFLGSFVLPLLAVCKGGYKFLPCLLHPRMKKLFFLALPLMIGQSIVTLDEQFIRIFGSLAGDGAVSLLSYARRIMLVPVGVVAQAAGLASFPFLASLAASNKTEEFNKVVNTTITNTLLLALPLTFFMSVSAEQIMRLIFQQGSFSSENATTSGLLLTIMMMGVAFWVVQQIIGRAFYAKQNTLTPALVGSLGTALALPLYWLLAKHFGAAGVAVASTAAVTFYAVIIVFVWQKNFGKQALAGILKKALSCLVFCMPASGVAYLAISLVQKTFGGESLLAAFAAIVVGGGAFTSVYLGSIWLFNPEVGSPIFSFAKRLLGKKQKTLDS